MIQKKRLLFVWLFVFNLTFSIISVISYVHAFVAWNNRPLFLFSVYILIFNQISLLCHIPPSPQWGVRRLCLWCLMPLSTIFQLYRWRSALGGGNQSTRRKPPTYRKSLTNLSHTVVSSTPRLSGVRTHSDIWYVFSISIQYYSNSTLHVPVLYS